MPRKKNVKPTLHSKKFNRSVMGEYTLVNKRGTKRFEVPLNGQEHMETIDLYKRIATYHNCDESMIIIEPGYYTVDNTPKENPYPNGVEYEKYGEDDGYEYNQRGNLVEKQGWSREK